MNTLSFPVLSPERFMAQGVLRGAVAGVVGMAWALVAGAAPPLSPSEAVSAAPLYSCPGPLFTNDIHPVQARAQGCTLAQQGRWSQAQAPALPQVAAVPSTHALPTGAVANTPHMPPPTPAPTPASVSLGSFGGSGSSAVSGSFGAFDGLPALGAMPVPAPQVSQLPLAAATVAAPASGQSNTAPSVASPLVLRPTASATVSHTASPISAPPPSPQAAPGGSGGEAQRQRDRHAREIVLAELASTQARIQSLSARPQGSADEDNALQRLRRDEDALRRELARRPG